MSELEEKLKLKLCLMVSNFGVSQHTAMVFLESHGKNYVDELEQLIREAQEEGASFASDQAFAGLSKDYREEIKKKILLKLKQSLEGEKDEHS